jgi:hypothetical protein
LALISGTALPLVVVITTIGVAEGRMRPVNAAALVGALMLSVLLYPMIARLLLGRRGSVPVPGVERNGSTPANWQGKDWGRSPGLEPHWSPTADSVPGDGDTKVDNPD